MIRNKISVVMATYNGQKYILEQLDSIVRQTVQPDEIIISDDCSTDQTCGIINEFVRKNNIQIQILVNEHNLGYILNFKQAMAKATGEYLFLCDQDDVWEKEKIEKTVYFMDKYHAKVACTGFKLIDGEGKAIKNLEQYDSDPISGYKEWTGMIKKIPMSRLIWGNFSPGCTYCFKREILDVMKKVNNKEISHDFQLLLIGANEEAAIYIDEPLSKYRLHSTNTIGMNNKELKRKRHFQPRLSRFLSALSKTQNVKNMVIYNIILYLRLPKIRSVIIHKFHLNNTLKI